MLVTVVMCMNSWGSFGFIELPTGIAVAKWHEDVNEATRTASTSGLQ
jgi:hypothetical protein